jgi:DNA-directed RNA polymerase specialized sigma24 family protein
MQICATDLTLEALSDSALRTRLAREDWENDPEYIPSEQVFRLFRRAREADNRLRMGLISWVLSRRLLGLARGYCIIGGIVPGIISDLRQASEELSQFVWECLVTRPKDAAHAEKLFGQLFKRRALDFHRRLLAKKRKMQDSLDAIDHSPDDDDPDRTIQVVSALRQEASPDKLIENKQEYIAVNGRLQTILSKNEYSAYVMLNVQDMKVKEVAAALGVTVKSINNYKNSAIQKIEKEFKQ